MSTATPRTAGFGHDAAIARTAGLCDRIVWLHGQLSRRGDLGPCPGVDALFSELVGVCVDADDRVASLVLADARIRRLRPGLLRLCSQGESLLEQAWAGRVLAAADPRAELGRFSYLDNYRQLSRLEVRALAAAGHLPRAGGRVCFLGGGPLPVSALLLHRNLGVAVDVIDNDARAAGLARAVLGRLGAGPGLRVVQADATSAADMARLLPGCGVVIVAALAGHTRDQKRAVLRAAGPALDPGACLLLRTARGLRSLLYAVVEPHDVAQEAGCTPHMLIHPRGDVINSVLIARRH